jgi:hypothetical protein
MSMLSAAACPSPSTPATAQGSGACRRRLCGADRYVLSRMSAAALLLQEGLGWPCTQERVHAAGRLEELSPLCPQLCNQQVNPSVSHCGKLGNRMNPEKGQSLGSEH